MATVYFFERLKRVYGAMFEITFSTQNSLLDSQDEWKSLIGKLERENIDAGIERLKSLMTEDVNYKWPNIPLTIGLCKRHKTHACHKANFPKLPELSTAQMQENRAKTLVKLKRLAQVHPIHSAIKTEVTERVLSPDELAIKRQRQDFEKQILSEAKMKYSHLNASSQR
jgi:hypothetical protein